MAYTDYDRMKKAILEQTLIELTDDTDLGVVDQEKIAGCIEAADSEIDGYIPEEFALPLVPVPRVISRISTVISIYNCFARYAGSIPDTWKDQYDNVVKLLEKIQSKKIKLRQEDEAGEPVEPAPAQRIKASSPARIFTAEKLSGY